MAITILGLTIGDDGSGWKVPTYAQWRDAISKRIRDLRGKANLQTQPGSLFGDMIDMLVTGVDAVTQNTTEAVGRTVFTSMGGVSLDQFLSDVIFRVVATPSTATVYAYGTAGAAIPQGTAIRSSPVATAFFTLAPNAVPAEPAEQYAVEIPNFPAGQYAGQDFTVTVDGTPAVVGANIFSTGEDVRNALVVAINALGQSQVAYLAGQNPNTNSFTLVVREELGNGPFPLTVTGPAISKFPAIPMLTDTAPVLGPTYAFSQSLRYGPPFAGLQGYTNITDAVIGRTRETDSQLKARWQLIQRGLGGGSPDAVRGIMLSDVVIGGGGLTFCSVEYNPTDVIDLVGNLPHSLRVVANPDVNPLDLGNALWRAKAAGDNTNGPFDVVIQDQQGNNQLLHYDVLVDRWVGVVITVHPGPDWPNTGDPISQLRQDVVDYINALQPTGNSYGVRVNQLPISLYPDGTPRGVANFTVQLGASLVQGGPYNNPALLSYPDVEPNAEAASLQFSSRQKAKAQFIDVTASIV